MPPLEKLLSITGRIYEKAVTNCWNARGHYLLPVQRNVRKYDAVAQVPIPPRYVHPFAMVN